MNDLSYVWGQRARAFWKEAAIYWSYALRSGLTAFLVLFAIIGSYLYMKILETLPTDYPYWRVTTPVLALALGFTPIRTFLRKADPIFLMPAESKLRGYWLRCGIYSYLFQAAFLTLGLLFIWPLYRHCEGLHAASFPVVWIILLAAKAVLLMLRFGETRLIYGRYRILTGILRWIGAVLLAFSILTQSYMEAAVVFITANLLVFAAISMLPKHRVHWEYGIRKEQEHLKVHYTFFSWFADVPKLQSKPKPRRFWSSLVERIPYHKGEAYRYLYTLTFIRTEIFLILIRIMAVAVFLFLVVEHPVVEPLTYAVALLMAAATSSTLDQSHRYSFWLSLYPVSRSTRSTALRQTALWGLGFWNGIVGVSFILLSANKLQTLLVFGAGWIFLYYYIQVPFRRRIAQTEAALYE